MARRNDETVTDGEVAVAPVDVGVGNFLEPTSGRSRLVRDGHDDYVLFLDFVKTALGERAARRGQLGGQNVDHAVHLGVTVDVDAGAGYARDGFRECARTILR